MVSNALARTIALSFTGAEEHPHFEKSSFRIKKKIFATMSEPAAKVVVKLNPADQFIYCKINDKIIYPVTGMWGVKGWTAIELKKVSVSVFKEMLSLSYKTVAGIK